MSRLCLLKPLKPVPTKWQARISAAAFTTAVGAAFSAESPAAVDRKGNDVSALFEARWSSVSPESAFATPEVHLPLGACKNSGFEQTVLVAYAADQNKQRRGATEASAASCKKGWDTAAEYQVCRVSGVLCAAGYPHDVNLPRFLQKHCVGTSRVVCLAATKRCVHMKSALESTSVIWLLLL